MYNRKRTKAFLLIGALAIPLPSKAEVVGEIPTEPTSVHVSPRTSAAANEIAEINERLAVLTARLAELEMKTNIAKKQEELNQVRSSPSSIDETFVPSVKEIDGMDGKLRAVLNVQDGKTQSVRVGDKAGAWTVKSIRMDSVTVQKGREVLQLGFGRSSLSRTTSPGQPMGQFPLQ